jgi:hypothetical protein
MRLEPLVVTRPRLRCVEVNTPAQKEKAVIRGSKSATTTPKLLSKVESLRLLSRVEEAGLLSFGAFAHAHTTRAAAPHTRATAAPRAVRRAGAATRVQLRPRDISGSPAVAPQSARRALERVLFARPREWLSRCHLPTRAPSVGTRSFSLARGHTPDARPPLSFVRPTQLRSLASRCPTSSAWACCPRRSSWGLSASRRTARRRASCPPLQCCSSPPPPRLCTLCRIRTRRSWRRRRLARACWAWAPSASLLAPRSWAICRSEGSALLVFDSCSPPSAAARGPCQPRAAQQRSRDGPRRAHAPRPGRLKHAATQLEHHLRRLSVTGSRQDLGPPHTSVSSAKHASESHAKAPSFARAMPHDTKP